MQISNKEHERVKLKCINWTHLHIGCGKDIGRWEYFFTAEKKQLAFLDYDKLSTEAINNESLMDQLTEEAAKDPSGSLQKFLIAATIADPSLPERISSEAGLRTLPAPMSRLEAEERSIRRLRLFAGSPNCYIPGSSIKGAIRSAYLSELIYASKLKGEILPRDGSLDDFSNLRLLRERLQKTFRPGSEDTRLFENLIVRDSSVLEAKNLGIASIGLFGSGKKNARLNEKSRQGRDSDEYAEVLLAGAEFEIEIVLRTCRRYKLPLNAIADILEIADSFFRRVWKEEHLNQQALTAQNNGVKDSLEFYENPDSLPSQDYFLMRVGYGAGQMSHSVLLPYRDHFREEFKDLADSPLRHSSLYRRQEKLKLRQPYPFTARTALAGERESWLPMGWIAISKSSLEK